MNESRIEVKNGNKRAVFVRSDQGWTPDWFYQDDRPMLRFKDHEWLSIGHEHPAIAQEAEKIRGGVVFRGCSKYGNVDVPWSIAIRRDKLSGGFVVECTFVPAETIELLEAYSTFETPYEYDGSETVTTVIGQNPVQKWQGPERVTPKQWNHAVIDRATAAAFEAVLEQIAGLDATVERVDVPSLEITDVAANAVSVEILAQQGERWTEHPERYGSDVAARLRAAETIPGSYATKVLAWDAEARNALDRLFTEFDVLATPTVGATRKVIGVPDIDIDGVAVFHRTVLSSYAWPVNRTGNPALALPIPGSGEPPASLQLIGARFGEAQLLEVGLALEEAGLVATAKPWSWFG